MACKTVGAVALCVVVGIAGFVFGVAAAELLILFGGD